MISLDLNARYAFFGKVDDSVSGDVLYDGIKVKVALKQEVTVDALEVLAGLRFTY